MITEICSIVLYCDNCQKDKIDPFAGKKFVDKSIGEAKRTAKKHGWRIGSHGELCPRCHKTWKAERKASRDKKFANIVIDTIRAGDLDRAKELVEKRKIEISKEVEAQIREEIGNGWFDD